MNYETTSHHQADVPQTEHTPFTLGREHQARFASERGSPDWRRFEVALSRHSEAISSGITRACDRYREIDADTAKRIAHVLGRSLGRSSSLARYASTGEGDYQTLRDEYLSLYHHPDVSPVATELIDWFGTRLIRVNYPQAETIDYREPYPLTLGRLLVPMAVTAGAWTGTVYVAGDNDSAALQELEPILVQLRVEEDPALQAYLSLTNVNAMSGDIMEGFHNTYVATFASIEDALTAVCDLDEREREVEQFANEKLLYVDSVTPDYDALRREAEEAADFVEHKGHVYVFYK